MTRLWRWLVGGIEPSWNQQIQVLRSETPLRLPAVKPLKAARDPKAKRKARVANFNRGRL